jgi:hypothetical protein
MRMGAIPSSALTTSPIIVSFVTTIIFLQIIDIGSFQHELGYTIRPVLSFFSKTIPKHTKNKQKMACKTSLKSPKSLDKQGVYGNNEIANQAKTANRRKTYE